MFPKKSEEACWWPKARGRSRSAGASSRRWEISSTELSDRAASFIAWCRLGFNQGQTLVTTDGGGKTIACLIGQIPGFKGPGSVPQIAGRSPTDVVRQVYDMQKGNRNGTLDATRPNS